MITVRSFHILALGLTALSAVTTSLAQEIFKIEDQGAVRSFVLAEDEVVLRGSIRNEARLRDDIQATVQGAKVLETRGGEALTKLDRRINRQQAAARMDVMQQSAPEYYSEP